MIGIAAQAQSGELQGAGHVGTHARAVLTDSAGEHERIDTPEHTGHGPYGAAQAQHESIIGEPRPWRACRSGLEHPAQVRGNAGHAKQAGASFEHIEQLLHADPMARLKVQQ